MARDGSGNYSLATDPFIPESVISSTQMNLVLTDIANAISESLPVSGERGMVGPFQLADGTGSSPAFAFNSESSLGLYRPGSGKLGFCAEGAEQMRLTVNGLIIGSTTDTGQKLQINGHASVTGTVYANRLETTDLGNIVSSGNVVSNGTVYASTNLLGQRLLVNAGTLAEPSINFNSYGAGFYFPTSGEVEAVGDGVSVAKFGVNQSEVNDTLVVRGTGADNAIVEIGKDRATSASAILRMRATGTGATNPVYDFAMSRTSGDNGVMYFMQQGTGRMQFESKSSECRFVTSSNTLTNRYVAATTSPDNGVFETSVSSSGQYALNFRNAALSTVLQPHVIPRSGTGGILSQVFRVGGDISTGSGSTTALTLSETLATFGLPVVAPVGTEAAPTFTFTGDTDTGMYRSASNNLDFSTGGVRRLNIDSAGRLYGYSTGGDLLNLTTTVNTGLMQITATTGTANINNFAWYLTSSGTAMLLLRNDAKTAYIQPITVTRNTSTSGINSVYFRVGGDTNVSGSDIEAGRFIISSDGAQPKLLVGNSSQEVYLNHADAAGGTNNYQVYSYKTGATGPVSLLGTDGSNNSMWAAARTNSGGRRVVHSGINGVSVASTAGAEKGKLELSTKAAADAGTVVRASIDETAAAFTVPVSSTGSITAPNLAYATKATSASVLVNDGIFNATAGFTLNTSDCAEGRVFTVYNNSASSITITSGAGMTIRLAGTATTGNRTLAQRAICTITCITSSHVVVSGMGVS